MADDINAVHGKLAKLTAQLDMRDVSPYLPVLRTMSIGDSRRRFSTQTSPAGVKWSPLKYPRISGGGIPLRDTGQLMASVQVKVIGNELVQGSNLIYAGVHQFGATIVPVNSKFLCIPATREAKLAGSPRRFVGKLYPRIGKSKRGGVLVSKKGKAETVQYYLCKKVVVPARPFLGFSAEFLEDVANLFGEIIQNKANKALE